MPHSSSFSGTALAREVLESAMVMEKRMLKTFIDSVRALTNDRELLSILRDIQNGKYLAITPGLEARLQNINIPTDDMVKLSRQSMTRAGRVTAKKIGVDLAFDITNPRAVDFARRLGADLITNIRPTTRQTIRNLISEVIDMNMSVPEARKLIAQRVGLLPQHADAVKRYRDSLIASGSTRKQADALADKYAKRLLRYRADMIARTEIARATSYGQNEYWQQLRDADRIPPETMRVWIAYLDEKTCPICGPMDGQLATLDGVWETGNGPVQYPTESHPNCRCTSGLVFTNKVKKVDPFGYEHWLLEKRRSLHGSV